MELHFCLSGDEKIMANVSYMYFGDIYDTCCVSLEVLQDYPNSCLLPHAMPSPRKKIHEHHENDSVMGAMASHITGLYRFDQPFVHVWIKENNKAPRHWLLWGKTWHSRHQTACWWSSTIRYGDSWKQKSNLVLIMCICEARAWRIQSHHHG